jgi:hypothetical protein
MGVPKMPSHHEGGDRHRKWLRPNEVPLEELGEGYERRRGR